MADLVGDLAKQLKERRTRVGQMTVENSELRAEIRELREDNRQVNDEFTELKHKFDCGLEKEQAMEVWRGQEKVEWEQQRHLEKQRHMRELNSRFEREEDNKERLEEWDWKFKEVLMWEERSRRRAADDREKSDRYEKIILIGRCGMKTGGKGPRRRQSE